MHLPEQSIMEQFVQHHVPCDNKTVGRRKFIQSRVSDFVYVLHLNKSLIQLLKSQFTFRINPAQLEETHCVTGGLQRLFEA